MTALERRWVESEWKNGLWSNWFRSPDPRDRIWIQAYQQPLHYGGDFLSGLCDGVHSLAYGPPVTSIEQAKADAESMYRQWVYDEYGVVLP